MGRIIFIALLTGALIFISHYLAQKDTLQDIVARSMQGTKGDYGIVIKNVKDKELYMQKEHTPFTAASLYKLWVMAAVYQQIKEGKVSEDETVSKDITALNAEFGIQSPGEGEVTDGIISLTVAQALHQMITISHNYSALLLVDRIGSENVTAMLKQIGLTESSFEDSPTTTAHDIALYYEKLYNGKIVDKASSDKMIELLKQQELNDRIPKYLPKEVSVGHKTGEIEYFKHDAGIVFTQKGDYIFVVLSESESPQGAAERTALLSKDVYDYFNTKRLF